ncbi:MAG: rRNA maturation RNase YbeY [Alphaproteobacteria bacterium]|nr:rRNA maturation RNase YbeY [Alphaproteobacteria bacterium]
MIEITTYGNSWKEDHIAYIKNALEKICKHLKISGEVSVLLTLDEEMRALNYQYRQKDQPTNILSFETSDPEVLGDLVLSFETIETEAVAQRKTFENHLAHLLVHGVLHLLGRDHLTDEEAKKMEAEEVKILKILFDIPNPYGEEE